VENKFLSKVQRLELLAELKVEDKARYNDRIKVILLLDEGKTYKSICEFLFIDEGTIRNWRKRYVEGGIEELVRDDWATKRCFLCEDQLLELSLYLEDTTYTKTKDIVSYVYSRYKVKYSISGMTKLLHEMNFSYKKSKGVPAKADKEAQKSFLRQYFGIRPHGKVYFIDSTHPRHCPELGYGWIKKGTEKEVPCNSGRSRLNISGAVCVADQDIIIRQAETINGASIGQLLTAIRSKNPKDKLYVVMDNARYNRSRYVKKLAKKLKIKLVYLPPYSPNLNVTERLWRFYRDNFLVNQYFEKFKDFVKSTSNFFRGIRKYRSDLETLLTDNFQTIGT
jgi:transposase